MKRIFKFRAWGYFEGMVYSEPLPAHFFACLDSYLDGHDKEVVIMQFSGLCDAEGKEIYEGDIIEDSSGERLVVSFWDGMFACGRQMLSAYLDNDDWKVVGNIYENKDLLN